MALVQCVECKEKMIEEEDTAILECPFCGSKIVKVISDKEE